MRLARIPPSVVLYTHVKVRKLTPLDNNKTRSAHYPLIQHRVHSKLSHTYIEGQKGVVVVVVYAQRKSLYTAETKAPKTAAPGNKRREREGGGSVS